MRRTQCVEEDHTLCGGARTQCVEEILKCYTTLKTHLVLMESR